MTGTFRKYVDWKPTPDTLAVLQHIVAVVEKAEEQGMTLTVRQLYYQLVVANVIPNKQREYNRVGNIVSNARMAGLLSWTAFEDRNRTLRGHRAFDSPAQAFRQAADSYKIDMWANQPWRPEVWVEKAALEGVIAGICNQLRVDFYAQRGYNSQTAQWEAAQRFASYIKKGQRPIVFHLGDHDPSGVDMTRDNADRLALFVGVPVTVVRLALTRVQIDELGIPPNPAKRTDSRSDAYIEEHGEGSWELDAMPPGDIRDLIRKNVMAVRDRSRWNEAAEEEANDLRVMAEMVAELEGDSE